MPVTLIAECGANHGGSMDTARKMVQVLTSFCHVDYVKWQKRSTKELPKKVRERPYDNPNSFGATYGEHRDALEFSPSQHRYLKDICEENGAKYSCSVWDIGAAKQIARLIPDYIKIPSACNTDFAMIGWLVEHYGGDIHMSTGMTTEEEKENILNFIQRMGQHHRFVLYHCTSAYPCPFEEVYLKDLWLFKHWRSVPGLKNYGFSGHHKGISVDIAAAALDCAYIERHFTLDRTMKGTDHAASLEPEGMAKLVRDIRAFEKAFQQSKGGVKACEQEAREKLKCTQ